MKKIDKVMKAIDLLEDLTKQKENIMKNTIKDITQNGLTFLQTTIPTWRVVVMNKALNIRFDNLEFFIQSKYGRLQVSSDGNYFFSISIVKEWNYETTFNGKRTLLNGEVLFNTINEMKQRAIKQFEEKK